jgi:hypothetical protein
MGKIYDLVKQVDLHLEQSCASDTTAALLRLPIIESVQANAGEQALPGATINVGDEENTFELIRDIWLARRPDICNDWVLASWVMNPKLKATVAKTITPLEAGALDRIVRKLLLVLPITGPVLTFDEKLNLFYAEKASYDNQVGVFAPSNLWVSNRLLDNDHFHIWYQQHALNHTLVFGRIGCRLLGKTAGIGGAERNWGALSDIVTKNRNRLTSDKVEMLTSIFARAHANPPGALSYVDDIEGGWTEADLTWDLGLSKFDMVIDLNPPAAKKVVLNFLEEWEEQEPEAGKRKKRGAVHEQNAGNQFRLLNKYQGLDSSMMSAGRMEQISSLRAPT